MYEMMKLGIYAAQEAGKILKDNFGGSIDIDYKGEINLVTEVDMMSEQRIIEIIHGAYPDHHILTEESEGQKGSSPYRWIVDPLDGTTNYAHGYPCFCVSIALEHAGSIIAGIIYDPVLDELFTAEKGSGAYMNGREIRVSETAVLNRSLLATGFPYDIREDAENNLSHFNDFIMVAQAIRRAGSAALDLCYVAMGRFDGFWELKLSPWDVAAGSFIVRAAGGTVTTFSGGDFSVHAREILATNGKVHPEMIKILEEET